MIAFWRAVTSARGSATLYAVGAAILLVLYSSWGRPIWYDEMTLFVFGGFENIGNAFSAIIASTDNMNHGQTGVYPLMQVLSMRVFGAHHWALRLPSLLFAVYYFAAVFAFVRARRLGPVALLVLPVLWLGYPTFLYYAGEGRTYMPLAAAAMGLLAYYSFPADARSRTGVRLLGWSAVLIGVLFHPYIALYWPAVMLFSFWTLTRERRATGYPPPSDSSCSRTQHSFWSAERCSLSLA